MYRATSILTFLHVGNWTSFNFGHPPHGPNYYHSYFTMTCGPSQFAGILSCAVTHSKHNYSLYSTVRSANILCLFGHHFNPLTKVENSDWTLLFFFLANVLKGLIEAKNDDKQKVVSRYIHLFIFGVTVKWNSLTIKTSTNYFILRIFVFFFVF